MNVMTTIWRLVESFSYALNRVFVLENIPMNAMLVQIKMLLVISLENVAKMWMKQNIEKQINLSNVKEIDLKHVKNSKWISDLLFDISE